MSITITQPDDWHLHLRDGQALLTTVPHSAAQFARAIIMPNLTPPITTVEMAKYYRQRILDARPTDSGFEPLMTLYLTESTCIDEVARAAEAPFVKAFKYYPAGATTNSDAGVRKLTNVYPLLEKMQQTDLVLCLHGEAIDPDTDIFDREAIFIERSLQPLMREMPSLKIVLEHITTRESVLFVQDCSDNIAATITPQHLLYNRNALFQGGIRPHYYCLPVLKHEIHRQALQEATLSGNKKFFLGTDSAPHATKDKESACGCAGIYSAHAALELYTEFFDAHNKLDKLEGFASFYGADFYQLPRNKRSVTLIQQAWQVPASYSLGDATLTPLRADETLRWKLSTTQAKAH